MRNVLVFSTKSNTTTSVETSATTWGELSSYLTTKGLYNPSGMKAIEKKSSKTLELKDAVLPEEDFVLILIPTKNESGAEFIEVEKVKEFFTEKLEELADSLDDFLSDNAVDSKTTELAEEAAKIKAELGIE